MQRKIHDILEEPLMRFATRVIIGLSAICFLAQTPILFGQAVYGNIYGTVTDISGAVVPGATITVTDEAKGTSVTVQSNGSGDFTADHLIPDTYDVTVAAKGFEGFQQKGIAIFADTSVKVTPALVVGGSNQTVEVNANTIPELKTDRADVSTEFDSKDVQDLPIEGRNFTNLQLLLPGAQQLGWSHAADENPQGSSQIQVDGQAFGGVGFILDGTDNQDPILGIIVINPALDSISETKITTQNFDAEFGKAISSVVTAQTKSGTNSFHGSAYDYRESNANLARNPFTQNPAAGTTSTSGLIPAGLRNQFGGDVGGPILKDKLFFFGDYEGVRQKVGTSASMTVPSAFLINTCLGEATTTTGVPGCDFSQYSAASTLGAAGVVYQPNGTPYPGNVIPATQLSQPALKLFKLLQPYAPNKAGNYSGLENNYAASGTGIFNNDTWAERVDYQLSDKTHVFERFSRFTDILSGTTIFGPAGGAGFGINNYGGNSKGANDSLAAGMDIAISPTLLTDWRIGYYRYNIGDEKYNAGVDFATNLGIPGVNMGTPDTSGAPGFNITDVGASGGPSNSQSSGAQYGSDLNITRCNCPLSEREDQFQIVNNWTKILGNHSFKVGADLRYARNLRVPSDTDRAGILGFGTGPTSNPAMADPGGLGFATFVLGQDTSFGRYVSVSTNAKEFQKRDFFYGQDTWRLTPNLTINYGVRYEFYFPESVNGKGNGSLMQMNNYASTDGYMHVAQYGKVPSNMGWNKATNAWNPRIGVAYQVDPKTVIRAGYGRSFDLGVFGSIFGHVVTQNLPVLANQELNSGSITGYAFCLVPDAGCAQPAGQPAVGGPVPYVFPTVPANGLLPNPGYEVTAKARPNSLRLPTIDAWNLSVQRSLTPTLSLTMAYVANKATHTLSAGDGNNTNPNEAAINLPAQYSIEGRPLHYDPNPTNPDGNGIGANGGTSNSYFLSRYYGGSFAACTDPNYATPTNETGIVPGMCGWTQNIQYYGDDQDSEFDSLDVTVTKQFSRGLSFTSAYAWQRGFDFSSNYSTWSRAAVKGRNNDIREQQEVLYGVYQLPFGRNQMFLSNSPGWLNEVIGGWQLSPVMTWSGGLPFTLALGNCSPFVPTSGNGDTPCYPNGKAGALRTHVGSYNVVDHNRLFFNGNLSPGQLPSGFSDPGLDQIGTGGRNGGRGPHFFNTDMSLQKNFPIYETLLGQFRVDAYNAFNNINLNFNGDGSAPIDQGPQYISGMAPGTSPRQLQFSLRLIF
jgi:outer membrane receptor protein involved in Fe transport